MSQEHPELYRGIPKYPTASRNVQERPEVSKTPQTIPEKATFTKSNQKLFRSIRYEDVKKMHHYRSLPTLSRTFKSLKTRFLHCFFVVILDPSVLSDGFEGSKKVN